MSTDNVVINDMTDFVIKDITRSKSDAIQITAINLTAQAKLLAPVDYAELEGSIMYRLAKGHTGGFGEGTVSGEHGLEKLTSGDKMSSKPKAQEAYVGTAMEHGIYQEFGTKYMAAQPYLRPAADIVQNGTDTITAVADAMKETVLERKKRGL